MAVAKPVILPDTFNDDWNWDDWATHFDNCSEINGWDATAKLKFLKVRLTGRAQSVFQRLPDDQKDTFAHATTALQKWFEPVSKQQLYAIELSTRRKRPTESWADLADYLRKLASKAYPDLAREGTDQLALTHYLMSLTDVQTDLHVKQRSPGTLEEAVSFMLQVEASMSTARIASMAVANCTTQEENSQQLVPDSSQNDKLLALVQKNDKLLALVQKLDQRLGTLENHLPSTRPPRGPRPPRRQPTEVVSFKCKQVGHYARGCASFSANQSGN